MKKFLGRKNFLLILVFAFLILKANSQSFTIAIQPATKVIYAGDTTSFGISVIPTGGFSASVSFSIVLPNCIDNYVSISPSIANSPYNNIKVNISNTSNISPSTYSIIIRGTNGAITTYDTCQLQVLPDTSGFNWVVYEKINSGLQSNAVIESSVDKLGTVWVASQTYNNGGIVYGNLTSFNGTIWEVFTDNSHKKYDNCGNLISSASGIFLPDNDVITITIDDHNNKWVGTANTIVKIDSLGNWSNINTSNSQLPGNEISCIRIDPLKRIWVGTWFNGFGIYNPGNSTWSNYNTGNSILPCDYITDIAFDNVGNAWMACNSAGSNQLIKFDGSFFSIYNQTNSNLPGTLSITSLITDNLNNVWIGTYSGIVKFDGVNASIYTVANSGLYSDAVTAVCYWKNSIWALSYRNIQYGAISVLQGNTWQNFDSINSPFPNGMFYTGNLDGGLDINIQDSSLWVCAKFAGLINIRDTTHMNVNPTFIVENENNKISDELLTSPNPFTTEVNIIIKKEFVNDASYTIRSLSNQVLYFEKENHLVKDYKKSIDLSKIPKGFYLLEVILDGEQSTKKIVKE